MDKIAVLTERELEAACQRGYALGFKQALAESEKFEELLTEKEIRSALRATSTHNWRQLKALNGNPEPARRFGQTAAYRLSQFPKTLH